MRERDAQEDAGDGRSTDMGTPAARHRTTKRPVRLIATAVAVALVVVGAVVVATSLRAGSDDADPVAAGTVAADEPSAPDEQDGSGSTAPGRGSLGSGDAGAAPIAPPPAPEPGDARVAAPEPDQPVGTATAAPVGTGAPALLAEGIVATVKTVTPVRTVPEGPGEKAGAGAVVRLAVRNDSGVPVDLSALTVTASAADGVPAAPSSGGVAAPLAGPLGTGEARAGTYVFTLPAGAQPSSIVVQAGLAGSATVVTVRAG